MEKKIVPLGNNGGTILITILIVLFFLSVMGLSLITYLFSRLTKVNLEADRLKAMYLAEAGIARAVYEIRKDRDSDHNGVGNVLKTPFAGGFYKASHNFQTSIITATGEFNAVRRTVQVKYSAI